MSFAWSNLAQPKENRFDLVYCSSEVSHVFPSPSSGHFQPLKPSSFLYFLFLSVYPRIHHCLTGAGGPLSVLHVAPACTYWVPCLNFELVYVIWNLELDFRLVSHSRHRVRWAFWTCLHLCHDFQTIYATGRPFTQPDVPRSTLVQTNLSGNCCSSLNQNTFRFVSSPWVHGPIRTPRQGFFQVPIYIAAKLQVTGCSYIKNLRTFLANRNTKHTQGSWSHWIIYPRTHDAGLQRFLLNLFPALGNFIAVLWIYVGPEAGPWQLFAAMIWIVSLRGHVEAEINFRLPRLMTSLSNDYRGIIPVFKVERHSNDASSHQYWAMMSAMNNRRYRRKYFTAPFMTP